MLRQAWAWAHGQRGWECLASHASHASHALSVVDDGTTGRSFRQPHTTTAPRFRPLGRRQLTIWLRNLHLCVRAVPPGKDFRINRGGLPTTEAWLHRLHNLLSRTPSWRRPFPGPPSPISTWAGGHWMEGSGSILPAVGRPPSAPQCPSGRHLDRVLHRRPAACCRCARRLGLAASCSLTPDTPWSPSSPSRRQRALGAVGVETGLLRAHCRNAHCGRPNSAY